MAVNIHFPFTSSKVNISINSLTLSSTSCLNVLTINISNSELFCQYIYFFPTWSDELRVMPSSPELTRRYDNHLHIKITNPRLPRDFQLTKLHRYRHYLHLITLIYTYLQHTAEFWRSAPGSCCCSVFFPPGKFFLSGNCIIFLIESNSFKNRCYFIVL